jgi:hypothetical protein
MEKDMIRANCEVPLEPAKHFELDVNLHMNTTIIPYASFMDRLYFIYKYKNRAT